MSNLIPSKYREILGLVATIAILVLGAMSEWGDMGAKFALWTGRIAVLTVLISNALGLSVPGVKAKAVAPLGVFILALLMMGSAGCNPYAAAWRTLDAVQHAKAMTAQQLATTAKARHEACKATHGANTDGYRVCIEPTKVMLRHWQREARPAIIAAVQVTSSALVIAEKVKAKDVGWVELLKPGICALARVVKLFKAYLPDQGASVLGVVGMAEGVTCE